MSEENQNTPEVNPLMNGAAEVSQGADAPENQEATNDQADQGDQNDQKQDDEANDSVQTDPTSPNVETTEDTKVDSVVETPDAPAQEEAPEVVPEPDPVVPEQTTVHTPQTIAPTQDDKVRYDNRAHRMKKILAEQPHVQFMIPLGIGEKKGAYDTVQINGYKLTIMKGAMVSLPQQVVELLAAKYEVDMTAGAEFRVDGDEARSDALS